jgi:membrane-associated phospholipid phosphatase
MVGTPLVYRLEPYVTAQWTVFFSLVYSVHIPLFFISAALHWYAGRRDRTERLLLTLGLAMYVGFIGYAFFPALGPVGAISGLRSIGENPGTTTVAAYGVALGTFPSLHAGVSFAVMVDAWRTSRRWAVVFTIVAVLIWLSTIYLRYHWVPDLIAGAILALLCDRLARVLQTYWPHESAVV